MRRLFFIVCCILALDICLAGDWWEDHFIIGAHWGPPLHHKYNNVDSPLVRNFNLLKDGGFNFILGKMNPHNYKTNSIQGSLLYSLIEECTEVCEQNELHFLNECGDPDTVYGLNIKDEPQIGQAHNYLKKIDTLKHLDHNPTLLGFINLLPSYSKNFGNFNDWKNYVDAYLGNDTLQVACFDNYHPHSQFSTDQPYPNENYYANLAYMKQLAGSRPLWAYLRSSEKFLEEKDDDWQDAYIRLGAFAPLAFGAKGIIYFSYDCLDRNRILRSPGRGGWRSLYFDNDEKSRQIFFGNFTHNAMDTFPDMALHTNDSLGTWHIKETSNSGTEHDMTMFKIGTWFGDHIHNMPNIYNWDFNPNGRDKFTTITSQGRLILSMFRAGWTHYSDINGFPTAYWSTMSRHTCPFGDFNDNKQLDLCLGWTENGQGKLRIYMDCHLDPSNIPSITSNHMLFDNTSQTFTFCDPIKQVIASRDSFLYVITSKSSVSYTHSDFIYTFKYSTNQFNAVDTSLITLQNQIDHYWMEDSLYAQDIGGNVWGEASGQAFSLTKYIQDFSTNQFYVWGQYNNRTNKYDRYAIAPDGKDGYQDYALLDRKGNPNQIYYPAQAVNQFINDSINHINNDTIDSIIMEGEWLGAYFSSTPNQEKLDSLKIIDKDYREATIPNPLPLINDSLELSSNILFGLFKEKNNDNLNLLVINMCDTISSLKLTLSNNYDGNSYHCDKITRMYSAQNPPVSTIVQFDNMLGGECAILHLTKIPVP